MAVLPQPGQIKPFGQSRRRALMGESVTNGDESIQLYTYPTSAHLFTFGLISL